MARRFLFRPYRRPFARPLRTARGVWSVREGFIVRYEEEGCVGYGEVAPIHEFGTETIAEAGAFLKRLELDASLAENGPLLDTLPCCAFGLSAAMTDLWGSGTKARDYDVAALLPAGHGALEVAEAKAAQGFRTFKWKIGVDTPKEERAVFRELEARLPDDARLRLDGNCSIPMETFKAWLEFLQVYRGRIDYIEQPFPVGEEVAMATLSERSGIPIALDESLNRVDGGKWLIPGAWSGPLVVKPMLAGHRKGLQEALRSVSGQVVLSSVFETAVGVRNALALADSLPALDRPIGFDTPGAFSDALSPLNSAVVLRVEDRSAISSESLWQQLTHSI